jgi:hypothetical protein
MIKKYLKEMPHINYGKNKMIDLELENFKTSKEIISFLTDIIIGDEFKDKYGNEIKLNSKEEKMKFLKNLFNNKMFKTLAANKFSENEIKLLNIIFRGVYV